MSNTKPHKKWGLRNSGTLLELDKAGDSAVVCVTVKLENLELNVLGQVCCCCRNGLGKLHRYRSIVATHIGVPLFPKQVSLRLLQDKYYITFYENSKKLDYIAVVQPHDAVGDFSVLFLVGNHDNSLAGFVQLFKYVHDPQG